MCDVRCAILPLASCSVLASQPEASKANTTLVCRLDQPVFPNRMSSPKRLRLQDADDDRPPPLAAGTAATVVPAAAATPQATAIPTGRGRNKPHDKNWGAGGTKASTFFDTLQLDRAGLASVAKVRLSVRSTGITFLVPVHLFHPHSSSLPSLPLPLLSLFKRSRMGPE